MSKTEALDLVDLTGVRHVRRHIARGDPGLSAQEARDREDEASLGGCRNPVEVIEK